jgi:hypothetical protein
MHSLNISYRPDNYPTWILWRDFPPGSFTLIGRASALGAGGLPSAHAGFYPRISLGKPQNACDSESTNRQLRRGYQFQVKFKGSGHVVFDRFRIHGQRLIERSRAK